MTLTREQMAKMSRLLDEALPLDEAGRREWLKQLQPELQSLSEALRAALLPDPSQGESLSSLPKISGVRELEDGTASGLTAGSRVGPYELIRHLGCGGMAEVWLAERADGTLKRKIALKLPLLTRFRKDLFERFLRERDILAALEHPNIARLYDAGIDDHALPYLSMEYVSGQPITAWSDAHKLGIRERLQLFLQVLAAMQYAHEKQVIHRDLKPSNILVTETGQVRLLDFGIAKLLVEENGENEITKIYGRALTPDYASPELLNGDPVAARSDVYSLGVVLYELLSGARPYQLKPGASLGTLEQAIATVDVKRPSARIEPEAPGRRSMTPETLARLLRGDLDVIALKALAKEPADRYESAAAMSEDLERYLQNLPIKVRPAGLGYRLRKFTVRNRPIIRVSALAGLLVLIVGAYELKHRVGTFPVLAAQPFQPPAHSIAVLPFVNMSEDKEQDYFSDGLTEELLNSLSRITDLQVAARTSSFSFQGAHPDIFTVAQKLNVATVLEGSVRRSGRTIRVTAQLNSAATGYRLWSQTYDRELEDVLTLQTDIATAVAGALKVRLLDDEGTRLELGGTRDPAAFDAYLRASKARRHAQSVQDYEAVATLYSEALQYDPKYALAYAGRSVAFLAAWDRAIDESAKRDFANRAEADAHRSIALAPDLADGHLALAYGFEYQQLDYARAGEEYGRALSVAPGNVNVLQHYGEYAVMMGQTEQGVAASRRAMVIDPLNPDSHISLFLALWRARRYQDALAAAQDAILLDSTRPDLKLYEGLAYYTLGEFEKARSSCELEHIPADAEFCLAMVYDKLGRHADAELMLQRRKTASARSEASGDAFRIAEVYAQWGVIAKALEYLETAVRRRDPTLERLKVSCLLDPLRNEPRFQAIEKALKFPDLAAQR